MCDADEQSDRSAVAVGCDGAEHRGDRLAVAAGAVDSVRPGTQRGAGHLQGVVGDIVVVGADRQHLLELAQQALLFGSADAIGSQHPGAAEHGCGDQAEGAEHATGAQHLRERGLHGSLSPRWWP
jgi:hypothetical protein